MNICCGNNFKEVAPDVNLGLEEPPWAIHASNTVALYANCVYKLMVDFRGFPSEKAYWDYITECGSAEIIILGTDKNERG